MKKVKSVNRLLRFQMDGKETIWTLNHIFNGVLLGAGIALILYLNFAQA